MMSTLPPAQPTRRRLIKGAAWAAPTAAVSVAAPAYAISQNDCGVPKLAISYRFTLDWNTAGGIKQQVFKFSELQFTITNLAPNVQVKSIDWGLWVDIRTKTRPYASPWQNYGLPYPLNKVAGDANSTRPVVTQPGCYYADCGWGQFSFRGATLDANNEVIGGTQIKFRDGSTRPAWHMKTTWTNTGSNFTRSSTTECGEMKTGRMGVTNNETASRVQTPNSANKNDSSWLSYTATETGSSGTPAVIRTNTGAIAYLSNGATVIEDNKPDPGAPNTWI